MCWVSACAPVGRERSRSVEPHRHIHLENRTTATLFTTSPIQPIPGPSSLYLLQTSHILNFSMLTAPAAVDITFDDDSWGLPPLKLAYNRAVSVGNSWGVTSIGRGFNWAAEEEEGSNRLSNAQGDSILDDSSLTTQSFITPRSPGYAFATPTSSGTLYPSTILTPSTQPIQTKTSRITADPLSLSPTQSPSLLSRPLTPSSTSLHISHINAPPRPVRSPTSPRPRRRSSQQRVSLIAGRLSIAPIEPPSPPPVAPQKLIRSGSTASLLSLDTSTRPPTPSAPIVTQTSNERSISEFVIKGEIGRGAYGLVKKAREMKADGRLGVSDVVICQPYLIMTLDSLRS